MTQDNTYISNTDTSDTNTANSVSFLGLGAMGYQMAKHLVSQFETVLVWNRDPSKAKAHASQFGSKAVSLAEAVTADIIISCLPTSAIVDDIIEQALPHLQDNKQDNQQDNKRSHPRVWVDCTSGVPDSAKAAKCKLQHVNCQFLDAPVSGQTTGAAAGTLTVMVGGDSQALADARVAIDCFAGLVVHVGDTGAGFAVKAVNNTLFAINAWAAAEGLSVLKAHGVNPSAALDCINNASGQSFASTATLPQRIVNRSFPKTFTIDLMAKDCAIAIDLQSQQQVPTPVMAQVASLIRAASNQHEAGTADFSQFATFYEQMTGVVIKDD